MKWSTFSLEDLNVLIAGSVNSPSKSYCSVLSCQNVNKIVKTTFLYVSGRIMGITFIYLADTFIQSDFQEFYKSA